MLSQLHNMSCLIDVSPKDLAKALVKEYMTRHVKEAGHIYICEKCGAGFVYHPGVVVPNFFIDIDPLDRNVILDSNNKIYQVVGIEFCTNCYCTKDIHSLGHPDYIASIQKDIHDLIYDELSEEEKEYGMMRILLH